LDGAAKADMRVGVPPATERRARTSSPDKAAILDAARSVVAAKGLSGMGRPPSAGGATPRSQNAKD
jgi:hypothetical protein